jgi:hypothetical protein
MDENGRFAMDALRRVVQRLRRRIASERGQSMTEYMLLISVLVIGLMVVLYDPMDAALSDGSAAFAQKMTNGTKRGAFNVSDSAER